MDMADWVTSHPLQIPLSVLNCRDYTCPCSYGCRCDLGSRITAISILFGDELRGDKQAHGIHSLANVNH